MCFSTYGPKDYNRTNAVTDNETIEPATKLYRIHVRILVTFITSFVVRHVNKFMVIEIIDKRLSSGLRVGGGVAHKHNDTRSQLYTKYIITFWMSIYDVMMYIIVISVNILCSNKN